MRYKIAYLSSKNPRNKKLSSGVSYYQSASLKKHCGEIHYLGPVKNIIITSCLPSKIFMLICCISAFFLIYLDCKWFILPFPIQ
jgi:hypothetical protein